MFPATRSPRLPLLINWTIEFPIASDYPDRNLDFLADHCAPRKP